MNNTISGHKRKHYKRYLEPGSHEPIPDSTWYEYKKRRQNELMEKHDCATNVIDESNDNFYVLPFSSEKDVNEIIHEPTNFSEVDSEVDENYFGEVQENTFEQLVTDDLEEGDRTSGIFSSIEDLIESDNFGKPLNINVNKSIGEIITMIVKYSLMHSLSLSAITDLFNLINFILPEPMLPCSRYLIDKLLFPKKCIDLHAICTVCCSYIGKFKRQDSSLKCNICQSIIDVNNPNYKDFFAMMDTSEPLSKLIESNSQYYKYVMKERVHKMGYVADIYDGKLYRNFVKTLNNGDKHNYATLTFNTDGAPLFKSSTYSIWPIFLMLNEVPFNVRSKELVLAGLWFGKDKPKMNIFLKPLVNSMYNMSTTGIQCTIDGLKKFVKVFILVCCVDSVARAPVQGFVQFNGAYGCGHCLHPGQWVVNDPKNARSGSTKYPLLPNIPNDRNAEDTIKHMKEATRTNKTLFGVKELSQLINLEKFDIIKGCVPDAMHCCSGIAKQIFTQWFGTKKKRGLFPRSKISEMDRFMAKIAVPNQISRLPRPVSEREFWKAKEWENWTLYYSLPILLRVLPEEYILHWSLFVEGIYLLSKDEIRTCEIDKANEVLHEFVGRSQQLYSKASMTFNMHLLLHMAKSVQYWGPLWSHTAFAFESGNGRLLKVIHAAKGVHYQICRRLNFEYSYVKLKYKLGDSFFDVNATKKTVKSNSIRYFGNSKAVNRMWLEKLHLSSKCAVSYKKIVKDGCLYKSALINKSRRSNNSFAQLTGGQYVQLHDFIFSEDTAEEHCIVKNVDVIGAFSGNCDMIKKIVQIHTSESAVLTKDIHKVCVHVKIYDTVFIIAVPNMKYY